MTKNNYSLYNSYNAEFGRVGQYFANKAAKDIKSVMGSGATQEVIDDVVKRAIDSGEKQVTQKVQRIGKKARRLWKASPKLRRNVKLAGVAGAGLVGLNALTGLKTVYDIGKGIKNKIMPKKQQNAQYSLFNPYAVEFARNQQEPKEKSELQRWGGAARNSALVGGTIGAAMGGSALVNKDLRKAMGKTGAIMPLVGGLGGAINATKIGLLGYGAYRGGKALVNKMRKKKEKTANYNALNNQIALFKETEQQPKKKGLLKKALKYGAIGGTGLAGLAAAKRYGGAALKYRKALARDANIKYAMKNNQPIRVPSFQELADLDVTIANNGAKGQIKRDAQTVRNVFRRKPKDEDFEPIKLRID